MLCVPGKARIHQSPDTTIYDECGYTGNAHGPSNATGGAEAAKHTAIRRACCVVCATAREGSIGRCEYPPKSLVELSMMSVMRVSMPLRAVAE